MKYLTDSFQFKVTGGYVFAGVGRYICEQLLGANSSPTVTELHQSYSYPWPLGTRWLNFGKLRGRIMMHGTNFGKVNTECGSLWLAASDTEI